MDSVKETLERYKKAVPLIRKEGRPVDFLLREIWRIQTELISNTTRIDIDSIWEEQAKKILYNCYLTSDEVKIIQQYGRLIDDELLKRLNYIKKTKKKSRTLRQLLAIEKIEYEYV